MVNSKQMKVHYIQHIDFEGLGIMEAYFLGKGAILQKTQTYIDPIFPTVEEMKTIDLLVVMGGPMSVKDEVKYLWLKEEKEVIKAFIESGKAVLGICLGAQLIAEVLGAKVFSGEHKEIGWFNIVAHDESQSTKYSDLFAHEQMAFHWHGETFDIPEGAIPLASSDGFKNQGFVYKGNVVALQCHLEMTEKSIVTMLMKDDEELAIGPYVQDAETMIRQSYHCELGNEVLKGILEKIIS
jgi:GMP synthase (glutamine-hydrolysing)